MEKKRIGILLLICLLAFSGCGMGGRLETGDGSTMGKNETGGKGIEINGIEENEIKENGTGENGIKENEIKENGTGENSVKENEIEESGAGKDGMEGNGTDRNSMGENAVENGNRPQEEKAAANTSGVENGISAGMSAGLKTGAESIGQYLPMLEGKSVGLVANKTSYVGEEHLLDYLLENGVGVVKVYAPEHGFRGDAEAGEQVSDAVDGKTGLPVISLYGDSRKPSAAQLSGVDVMLYDIQDVGVRFFTYISTMHYVMESCAENHIPLIVLDRPNPNIDYVAGPVRSENAVSFVSMDPIPIVYGMTDGELAQMINGEGWLANGAQCELTVIPVANYTRNIRYEPPIAPSPNLSSYEAVRLYPSLCLFEASIVSVGRGTPDPFTAVGYPDEKFGEYVFTPEDIPGKATNPMYEGQQCYGTQYRDVDAAKETFTVRYFVEMYRQFEAAGMEMIDRPEWLALLWGNENLFQQIKSGAPVEEIEQSYAEDVQDFLERRKPYLLYADE